MSTVDQDSSSPEVKNFLDRDFHQFSERALQAAKDGRLRAEPLLRCIERVYRISLGLQTICRIAHVNQVREDALAPGESEGELEQPLSRFSVGALLDLGAAVMESLPGEIEELSTWADKHGITGLVGGGVER